MDDAEQDNVFVPSHYKKYTVGNRKILRKKPNREDPKTGESFDNPAILKVVDLARFGEDSLERTQSLCTSQLT